MISATTMFAPLSAQELAEPDIRKLQLDEKLPIVPVPVEAPDMQYQHPIFGKPANIWAYHDIHRNLVGYIVRFEYTDNTGNVSKNYLPITYCELDNGQRKWCAKGFPEPRPLYGLPGIVTHTDAPIIVTEGEKAADAAAILFPDMTSTTPPHGAKSPHKSDWSAIAGRDVIIATDNDDAGQQFGDKVFDLVRSAGAKSILHLPPDRLGAWVWHGDEKLLRDNDIPKGWDIADAIVDGWTAESVREIRNDPAFLPVYPDPEARITLCREPDENTSWPFRVAADGIEMRIENKAREGTVEWKWFCSHLEVTAETRSTEGEDWGRLLCVTDRDGRTKEWAMPMSMLAGEGTTYRERLLSLGMIMSPGRFAREALHRYISTARPKQKAQCVNRLGWNKQVFVLPKQTFGNK